MSPNLRGSKTPSKAKNHSLSANRQTSQSTLTNLAPAAISRRVSMAKPVTRMFNGRTTITHTEFVSVVTTTNSFSTVKFVCNPGLIQVFPWLAAVAQNYDRYRFRKLQYAYVPAVSTATAGRVSLAFSHDANQPSPQSSQQAFSIVPNEEAAVWSPFSINVRPDNKEYYTRTYGTSAEITPTLGESSGSIDLNVTDMGVLFFSSNYANVSNAGEIYVSYEIELIAPTFTPAPLVGEVYSALGSMTNLFPSIGTYTAGPLLANTTVANGFAIKSPGRYLLFVNVTGTVLVVGTGPTLTAVSGGVSSSILTNWAVEIGALRGFKTFLITATADQDTGLCVIVVNVAGIAATTSAIYVNAASIGQATGFV